MNSLTDRKIIDEVVKRHQNAGVPIFLLIRGNLLYSSWNPREDGEYPCRKALSEDFWNIQGFMHLELEMIQRSIFHLQI